MNILKMERLEIPENERRWFYKDNILDSVENSDAIIIVTDWDSIKIKWSLISKKMRHPACF